METLCIVAEFDVSGNVCSCVFAGGVDGAVDAFDFHGGVEGFRWGVVEAHSGGADRSSDVQVLGRGRAGRAGIVGTAVRVKPNPV